MNRAECTIDRIDIVPTDTTSSACRAGCGACCIAPSITSAIPGMPEGKPAGVRCIQLDDSNLCQLFGQPERPRVCLAFDFDSDMCGNSRQQAMDNITWLEQLTS